MCGMMFEGYRPVREEIIFIYVYMYSNSNSCNYEFYYLLENIKALQTKISRPPNGSAELVRGLAK